MTGSSRTAEPFSVLDDNVDRRKASSELWRGNASEESECHKDKSRWHASPEPSESGSSSRSLPISSISPTHARQLENATNMAHSSSSNLSALSSGSLTDLRPASMSSSTPSAPSPAVPIRRSHSNLSASLLTPTLASALGIIPSARRRRNAASKHSLPSTALTPSSLQSQSHGISPSWSRRPSLPTMNSAGVDGRTSVYSVASFESLPEGEAVLHMASSPLSSTSAAQHSQATNTADESIPPVKTSAILDQSTGPVQSQATWSKRKNIAMELLETERAFVASLRIVNEHYYKPLSSLSRGVPTSQSNSSTVSASPVLSRKALSEIFSNFADIMHLNTELLTRLEDRLSGRNRDPPNSRPVSLVVGSLEGEACEAELSACKPWDPQSDRIGDLLASFAPFLKMYSFYVKNFSSALARVEAERKGNEAFARFLKETERITWMTSASGRSNGFGFGLGLQAHLLTIVQRIPRYKLLVGELVKTTPTSHRDFADLRRAFTMIEQVAESINDNIRQHEMILVMLEIQRTLVGLNVPLIVPGRALIRRATLLKAGRKDIHPREFFLFSDCIMYAAPVGNAVTDASAAWQAFAASPVSSPTLVKFSALPLRSASPDSRRDIGVRKRTISVPSQVDSKRLSFSVLEGQQLQFRGKFALQDCTVVGVDDTSSSDPTLRHYFEIRTPGKSFAVYAGSAIVKQEWLAAIRSAREELMSNRRTLHAEEDSITAKRDRRRSLQTTGRQVSFPRTSDTSPSVIPEGAQVNAFSDVRSRRESLPALASNGGLAAYLGAGVKSTIGNAGNANLGTLEMRGGLKVLEEYNAPVWVPDSRADKCARCNEGFGLWRRKHHCRLCGQVVCWSCSQRSFLIASYEEGEQDRPARACDTCYESVFPESPMEHPCVPSNAEHGNADLITDRPPASARSSQAMDSDASIPSSPPTPTSPQAPCIMPLDDKRASIVSLPSNGHGEMDKYAGMAEPRHRSVSPPTRQAPAARIAKAHVLEAQVFQGRMLSPQVHAATSGTGTFRLVTPRLTTPEHERPPLRRWSKTHEGAHSIFSSSTRLGEYGQEDLVDDHTPSSSNPPTTQSDGNADGDASDYFAGAMPGQNRLPSSSRQAPQPFPLLAPRRRKLMSAAARLSSVYSALPPSTGTGNGQQSS